MNEETLHFQGENTLHWSQCSLTMPSFPRGKIEALAPETLHPASGSRAASWASSLTARASLELPAAPLCLRGRQAHAGAHAHSRPAGCRAGGARFANFPASPLPSADASEI